jgi:hypothetical protein
MAVKANITIDQGTDFDATIDLSTPEGLPVNLTGFTVASQMRKNYASASETTTFIAEHNNLAGQIVLKLPKDDYTTDTGTESEKTHLGTNSLEPGRYLYDVEITSPVSDGSKTSRVVQGTATVTAGITRI